MSVIVDDNVDTQTAIKWFAIIVSEVNTIVINILNVVRIRSDNGVP